MAELVKTYWPVFVALISFASLVVQTLLAKTYAKREAVSVLDGRITMVEQ